MKKSIKYLILILAIVFSITTLLYKNQNNDLELKKELNTKISKQVKTTKLLNENSNLIDKKVSISKKNTEKDFLSITNNKYSKKELDSVEKIREKYHQLVNFHPMRTLMKLPKAERKALCLPSRAYHEQEWLYTADPNLGYPTPEETFKIQKELNEQILLGRVPGDGMDNQWIERGPNNVGGRTRMIMFAPGSTTKVFAGGVSGGLWVNNDITNASTQWTQVEGVPGNMAITCMAVDPQNSNIMYIGTGEVYIRYNVNGNGIYKSIDGGVTWKNIFDGTTNGDLENQLTYVQDIIAWVNPTTSQTEIYFGADGRSYTEEITAASGGAGWTTIGQNTIGLWKSTDGLNFTKQTNSVLESSTGNFCAPESFVKSANGDLYMGTKKSYFTGEGGGRIYKCTNGSNWSLIRTLPADGRTRLVASQQNNGRMYALCDITTPAKKSAIYRSTDNFVSDLSTIAQPTSSGSQPPPADDFTRGQGWYDIMIGMNPSNDNEVYIGGIEIYKTTTAFTANATGMWTQYTDWTVAPTANGSTTTVRDGVHADQHCIAFAPGMSSRVIFGNDGGVYYSNDGGNSIGVRSNGYNTAQFYKAAINQTGTTQKLVAGAQDNGTQFIDNAPNGVASSSEIYGGDGCWVHVDKQDEYIISSYTYNNYRRHNISGTVTATLTASSDGEFANPCGLDSNSNILYSNGSTGTTYRIYRYSGTNMATKTTLTNTLLNDIPSAFEASPYTSNRLLVGLANGRLLRVNSANGTPTWAQIGDATWLGAISSIRYGASESEIYVTFHNYGVVNVWYTSDGGTTWQNKEGDLPNIPVKCILANPSATNEVLIGTELGVWYTTNFNSSSPNWRRSNNGMKDVKVVSFDYRATDKTILVSTYGRGMFSGVFWSCGDLTSTWNGSAWSNGVPTSKTAVVFSGNFSSTSSLNACSVTVNTGKTVTINAGHTLKVGENITVNGTGKLNIENNAALIQYTKHAINTGNVTVKRNSAPMKRLDYTAWSSPVAGQNLLAFSPNTLTNRFYEYLYTGTNTATSYQSVNPSTNNFSTAKGYMIRVDNTWSSTTASSYNGVFTGIPNNGNISNLVGQGYNLLGNPYASPINAYKFLIKNPEIETIYYWTHTAPAVGGIYPVNNYASYTTLGGTASAAGGAIPNDKIQVGQGFFVKAGTSHNVVFDNELREDAISTTQFFKNSQSTNSDEIVDKHRIWLNLNDNTLQYNQILIGYTPNGTDGVDQLIDGKIFDSSNTSIYSLINNEAFVIQGKGNFNDTDTVKLGLKVNNSGNYEINLEQFDGLFENQDIYLKDNFLSIIHDLKTSPYLFSSQEGVFNNRFEIQYTNNALSNVDIEASNVNLIKNQSTISIHSIDSINRVEIYDILGKLIYTKNYNDVNIEINNENFKNQVLIVKIKTNKNNWIVKKAI